MADNNDNLPPPGEANNDPESLDEPLQQDESPLASSADSETHKKRQRMSSPSPTPNDVPSAESYLVTGETFKSHNHITASPPKFVSLDAILAAADGVGNMTLAHEIAVDEDFKLKKFTPENSLEKQVRDVMHQAFWDDLQEKLSSDPPDYTQALSLLEEVRESLLDVLLPQHTKLKANILEVLDMELIQQQAEHDALDVHHYAAYILDIMAKLCAPVRDERIAEISAIKDVVPLFREIFAVLDLMKMDMANFTIQQIRPFIQKQSVEYERTKFANFLAIQNENNLDGLICVKEWLTRHADRLQYTEGDAGVQIETDPQPTPAVILNAAFLDLLEWDDTREFPETLMMDYGRITVLRDRTQQVTLISAILLMTYSIVGAPIAGIAKLKNKLKDDMITIMADKVPSELGSEISALATHVIKEVQKSLVEHGFGELEGSKQELLRGQILAVQDTQHTVHQLLRSRIMGFISELLCRTQPQPVKFPPATSTISEELNVICGQFLRLISHNRNTFGSYYAGIISGLLQRTQPNRYPVSPRAPAPSTSQDTA